MLDTKYLQTVMVKKLEENLQSRKRQLVKDTIYEVAIELFTKKGFDETTVEEIAEAAGISRRSFFRYFQSKDDLLALNTVNCGEVLRERVASCPAGMGPLEVVRETVSAGVKFAEAQQFTRQIIEVARRSESARQAHLSRLMEVHDNLSLAFSAQMRESPQDFLRPFLLAGMTQLVINASTGSWYMGEHKDIGSATRQAFLELAQVFGNGSAASRDHKAVGNVRSSSNSSKASRIREDKK